MKRHSWVWWVGAAVVVWVVYRFVTGKSIGSGLPFGIGGGANVSPAQGLNAKVGGGGHAAVPDERVPGFTGVSIPPTGFVSTFQGGSPVDPAFGRPFGGIFFSPSNPGVIN